MEVAGVMSALRSDDGVDCECRSLVGTEGNAHSPERASSSSRDGNVVEKSDPSDAWVVDEEEEVKVCPTVSFPCGAINWVTSLSIQEQRGENIGQYHLESEGIES